MVKLFIKITLVLLIYSVTYSDVLYLNDGEEYEGTILSISNTIIKIKLTSNEVLELAKKDVYRIEFEEWEPSYHISNLEDTLIFNLWEKTSRETLKTDIPYINLYEEVEYMVNSDNTWSKKTRMVQKVNTDVGMSIANKAFYFKSKTEKLEINYVRVIKDEGEVFDLRETAIKDESINYNLPEYENLHRKKFAARGVEPGSIIDFEIMHSYSEITPINPFYTKEYFRRKEPLEKKIVKVILPKYSEFIYEKVNFTEGLGKFFEKQELQNGQKIYKWEILNSPRVEQEPLMPPVDYFYPYILGTLKNNWKTLGKEYYDILDDKLSYSKELKRLLKNMDKENKLNIYSVYNYVAKEIKLNSIDINEYSSEPKELKQIYKNKSAGYLDKAFLLYGLYKRMDLDVNLLLVKGWNSGPIVGKIPLFAQFSHALVHLKHKGNNIYLAPFNDRTPFGELPQNFQGIDGLMIDEEQTSLVQIPRKNIKNEGSLNRFNIKLESSGKAIISQSLEYRGEEAVRFRSNKDLKEEEFEDLVEEMVYRIHPGSVVDSFYLSDLEDLNTGVLLKTFYHIDNYAIKAGEEYIIFDLPGLNYSAYEVGKESKLYPLFFHNIGSFRKEIMIELPPEYSLYYIPDNIDFTSEFIDFRVISDNVRNKTRTTGSGHHKTAMAFAFHEDYFIKKRLVSNEKYLLYRDFIKLRAELSNISVILIKE